MEYGEALEQAKRNLGLYYKGCTVCNGMACRNTTPGPEAKRVGDTAIRNFQKWQEIRVSMDTICENWPIDTLVELSGRWFAVPFFVDLTGAIKTHYGEVYTEEEYNDILVSACAAIGTAAFTGNGLNAQTMVEATKAVARQDGISVPAVKPWNIGAIEEKMALVRESGAFTMAMDIGAAGLSFLKNMTPPAGGKSVEEMKEIVKLAGIPLILRGVMTVKGTLKAKEANAKAVMVSNHGGRILNQCPSTAEILPAIVKAVGQEITVLADGGIRSGVNVFKALAMGADDMLIAEPFVTAIYGGGVEDMAAYIKKLSDELTDTMVMCNAHTIGEITRDTIWN